MAIPQLYPCFKHWDNQTIWIFSDTHFGDKELRAGEPGRPTDDEIVKNINSKVGRKDTLILLGDVGDVEYVRRLRGYKVLICGNHDIGYTTYQRQKINKIFDKEKYTYEQVKEIMKKEYPNWNITIDEGYDFHSPFTFYTAIADNCLFDEVYTGALIIGEKLIISHEPIQNITWAFNIHGHVHDIRAKDDKYHLNCCAEAIHFIPVNFNQLVKTGICSPVETIHRETIDRATAKKKNRGKRALLKLYEDAKI